mmetsp:Transcript_52600/g.94430  ORF Transcript_52600/g.94430 Transcript_52600/m.94430 type:complete len:648 (-) Transcript_52600:207-2150(-)|eukprot:CAMPEP_0197631286 /NCGR_PEP_ID=MMETSP1338-20131121/8499_1 /TAXON_ID=43686 ORGANISM="Pelagodinium beii, Strain RCC1491" /NCGR_SAMPLE_ID=MMETSP1338 /ASSEMBLY_ACC=CAM_ASM_000754 /LENGTH=647 /DNA_ID=CAMNT_0043202705 /DNA_START=60 /DNA_END=2003 /DNA_ORIENTATION=-
MPDTGPTDEAQLDKLSVGEVTQLLRWRFCTLLTEKGGGSLLRGWRTELDPDFKLRTTQKDLQRAAASLGIEGGSAAADLLLRRSGSCDSLSLVELAPEAGVLVCKFRRFVGSFGSAKRFFNALASGEGEELSLQAFITACRRQGLDATDKEITDIFCLCDVDGGEMLSLEEVLFLEPDAIVRQQEEIRLKQLQMSQKGPRQAFMAECYTEELGKKLSDRHRLAPRPWQSKDFEALPKVICRRNQSWFRGKQTKTAEARDAFLTYIRSVYGCEIRAWRRGLDPQSTFELTLPSLKTWFRAESRLRETVELSILWKSLDRDGSGSIGMEELAPWAGEALAFFQLWMKDKLGSCEAIWDHPAAVQAFEGPQRDGLWKSRTKLLNGPFAKVIKDIGYTEIAKPGVRSTILSSLDYFGCGFISREDLQWLDSWEPPEWLCSEPDPDAWADIRKIILSRYDHPLAAWRGLLDRDDSNSVSWREFKDACRRVGYRGNLGGAWRALDDDLSGAITLQEFDQPSFSILESFKKWGEANFGSVELLFKSIDDDASGTVTFPELRRACKAGKWGGDVHTLFNCLDVDGRRGGGKRSISIEELLFLDSWEPADDEPLEPPPGMGESRTFTTLPTLQSQHSASAPALPKVSKERSIIGRQ